MTGRETAADYASTPYAPATEIAVRAERPYAVVVGHGLGDRLADALGPGVRRAGVVFPEPLRHRAEPVLEHLASSGVEVLPLPVPAGEAAKTAEVAAGCWARLGGAGFTRSDAVVGLGGGSTTDLAGFVAGTWLRGVRAVLLPTTLLAMVDAAVGGKTGINTAAGKNLVGVFHEPAAVLCDLDHLTTLPPAELRSGLAEVAKCGFIADPAILPLLETSGGSALDPSSSILRELVERSVRVKASVVSADLREATSAGGRVGREMLNYGHTLGHAIERREGYRWRHGEAISVGMVFVAELARRAGLLDPQTADRHRTVLAGLGLPVSYAADAFDELLAAMAVDKKSRGAALRLVVLAGLASPAILEAPDPDLLRAAYAAVSSVG
ncbi:MAG: 3-dehydroquinate synthase [Actinomycetes bacterium]